MDPRERPDNPELRAQQPPREVDRPAPRLPRWLQWTREHQHAKALDRSPA